MSDYELRKLTALSVSGDLRRRAMLLPVCIQIADESFAELVA
jgi:hypothetical protein